MNDVLKNEYSEQFDKERRARVEVSFYKYGPSRENFGAGRNNAAQSMVNQAQNAGVQTQQASFNDFEALIADSDVPF